MSETNARCNSAPIHRFVMPRSTRDKHILLVLINAFKRFEKRDYVFLADRVCALDIPRWSSFSIIETEFG